MASEAHFPRFRNQGANLKLAEIPSTRSSAGHISRGFSRRLAALWGVERNVAAASVAVFLVALGEELWKKFLPKHLESLNAGIGIIGLFGTTEDFLDAIYQYPGGWITDRWGRRRAFVLFLTAAAGGYLVYLFGRSAPFMFLGLALTMVWQSMGSPAIFATIGDALPKERRAMGFTVQSMLKRIPMVVSPILGGMLMGALGQKGFRTGLVITLALVGITVPLLLTINLPIVPHQRVGMRGVWDSFPLALKRLLLSDIVIRTCEGMADIFVVLYVTNVTGIAIARYGVLVAVQLATAIAIYLPSARIADRVGRKPFVIATFLFFALYPISVILAHNFLFLILAFIIGGLREIGEPSRKAMIVDYGAPHLRARSVGLYYLIRSLSITPASAIGGLLWKIRPDIPFLVAGAIGIGGTILFTATVE
jgi:MFS family permease